MLAGALALIGLGMGLCSVGVAQEMCSIQGSTGACQAQLSAVALTDHGCVAWVNASYQGSCLNGKLEGVALLRRPNGDGKNESQFIANFRSGIPIDTIVRFHREVILVNKVLQRDQFATCVWFDESGNKTDDKRGKNRMCNYAATLFGTEILSDATYQAIRSGRFNISSIVTNAPVAVDDPKTTGRGARGD
jgi:hypothetical protein